MGGPADRVAETIDRLSVCLLARAVRQPGAETADDAVALPPWSTPEGAPNSSGCLSPARDRQAARDCGRRSAGPGSTTSRYAQHHRRRASPEAGRRPRCPVPRSRSPAGGRGARPANRRTVQNLDPGGARPGSLPGAPPRAHLARAIHRCRSPEGDQRQAGAPCRRPRAGRCAGRSQCRAEEQRPLGQDRRR